MSGVACALALICSNVVWLADTNYRIYLDNGLVRSLASQDDYDALLAADQVRLEQNFLIPSLGLKPSIPRTYDNHV